MISKQLKIWFLFVTLVLAMGSSSVFAVGLGQMTENGVLGRSFVTEVAITGAEAFDASAIKVIQLNHSAASKLGVDISGAWTAFEFAVKNKGRGKVLEIRSTQPIAEPLVDLVIQVAWSGGRVYRHYPLMFDLP